MSSSRPSAPSCSPPGSAPGCARARAKVLHELGGPPARCATRSRRSAALDPERVALVVGHQADAVRRCGERRGAAGTCAIVLQAEQRGTGHAVACAADAFAGFAGDVLILYGDVPADPRRDAARRCWTRTATSGATCRCSPFALQTRRAMAGSSATRGRGRRHRRGARRDAGRARDHGDQPRLLLSSAPRSSFRCSASSDPTTRRASSTSPTSSGSRPAAGQRVREPCGRTAPTRSPASTRGRSWREMEAMLRRELVERWMAGGRHLRGPGDGLRRARGDDRRATP